LCALNVYKKIYLTCFLQEKSSVLTFFLIYNLHVIQDLEVLY